MAMSRWFRHYAGMMRDEKLVRCAVKSKQPVERVVWVWGAILESAAEINDGGRYEFDAGEVAYFLRCDEGDITSIVGGLEGSGRLAGGVVARWGDRQFSSDAAAERQRRYRARKSGSDVPKGDNHHNGDAEGDVTQPSRDANVSPQETETELDTETHREEANASSARKRGSRLPDTWVPDEVFASREGLSAETIRREAASFRDYWRGMPGQRGVKADWDATWRNWVRKAASAKPLNKSPSGYDWDADPANRNVL